MAQCGNRRFRYHRSSTRRSQTHKRTMRSVNATSQVPDAVCNILADATCNVASDAAWDMSDHSLADIALVLPTIRLVPQPSTPIPWEPLPFEDMAPLDLVPLKMPPAFAYDPDGPYFTVHEDESDESDDCDSTCSLNSDSSASGTLVDAPTHTSAFPPAHAPAEKMEIGTNESEDERGTFFSNSLVDTMVSEAGLDPRLRPEGYADLLKQLALENPGDGQFSEYIERVVKADILYWWCAQKTWYKGNKSCRLGRRIGYAKFALLACLCELDIVSGATVCDIADTLLADIGCRHRLRAVAKLLTFPAVRAVFCQAEHKERATETIGRLASSTHAMRHNGLLRSCHDVLREIEVGSAPIRPPP